MKVITKLALSFMILMILGGGIGVTNIIVLRDLGLASTDLYENQTAPLSNMSTIIETLELMRVNMREYVIGTALGDQDQIERAHTAIEHYKAVMTENLNTYRATMRDEGAISLFAEARSLYDTGFKDCLEKTYAAAISGAGVESVYALVAENIATANKIAENFDMCMEYKIRTADTSSKNSTKMTNMVIAILIPVLSVALITAVTLTLYISGIIGKPLVTISGFLQKASSTGELALRPEDIKNIKSLSKARDEIGVLSNSLAGFLSRINDIGKTLETVADGDLTTKFPLLSEKDTMGLALQKMLDSLNVMFGEISASSAQVSAGSKQIADGAQALAQGSTEQASAIEELSSSINEITGQTKQNADIAKEAAALSGKIRNNAEKGNGQMKQMMQAVIEINESSNQISKVIKVIDDIAFQTNILALNAAVEAARAGQHGKGFAVVAEEVRNLAAKSAEAARNTGGLIENSIEKANLGLNIAGETSASLKGIVEGINRSAEIATQISTLSDKQAAAITQINIGIDQVAQVVQQNSATAEESAAASEEMSGQSNMLAHLISQFRLKDSGFEQQSTIRALSASGTSFAISEEYSKNFGKY